MESVALGSPVLSGQVIRSPVLTADSLKFTSAFSLSGPFLPCGSLPSLHALEPTAYTICTPDDSSLLCVFISFRAHVTFLYPVCKQLEGRISLHCDY